MPAVKTYTLDEIRELCLAYDREFGEYRETAFEGQSVYDWIANSGKYVEPEDYLTHFCQWEELINAKVS